MDVREKLVEQAISHFWYGISHDIFSEQVATYAKLAIEALKKDNGVTVQEWISVKDRLPTREDANETESILAINKDEKYVGRWIWDIVARWPTEFTYWMPLPKPPKGE